MEYEKKCPNCNKILSYSRNYTLSLSIKENWKCKNCCSKRKPTFTPEEAKQRNKESNKKSDKKYYQKNKEKKKIYDKEYKQKLEIKLHYKEYYKQKTVKKKKNIYMKEYCSRPEIKIKISKYRKEYKKRLETIQKKRDYVNDKRKDPLIKLYHNFSTNIRSSLKRYTKHTIRKNGIKWENIVGYTVQELKKHLENLFQPGMSWNNYGNWHIDHIIPKSFFEYKSMNDVEFKYCWSLNNLQPLWAKDNLKKGDKIKNLLLL